MKIPAAVVTELCVMLLTVMVSGCARQSAQPESRPADRGAESRAEKRILIRGAPDWVNNGTRLYSGQDGRVIRGVGFAFKVGDMARQKSVADDRARAEIQRILLSYLGVVFDDFQAAGIAGNLSASRENLLPLLKTIVISNMSSARISGGWRDADSTVIWSVAELDMRDVKSSIAVMDGLGDDFKQFIGTSADTIFDRIAQQQSR